MRQAQPLRSAAAALASIIAPNHGAARESALTATNRQRSTLHHTQAVGWQNPPLATAQPAPITQGLEEWVARGKPSIVHSHAPGACASGCEAEEVAKANLAPFPPPTCPPHLWWEVARQGTPRVAPRRTRTYIAPPRMPQGSRSAPMAAPTSPTGRCRGAGLGPFTMPLPSPVGMAQQSNALTSRHSLWVGSTGERQSLASGRRSRLGNSREVGASTLKPQPHHAKVADGNGKLQTRLAYLLGLSSHLHLLILACSCCMPNLDPAELAGTGTHVVGWLLNSSAAAYSACLSVSGSGLSRPCT